jgi:hypothetical protein
MAIQTRGHDAVDSAWLMEVLTSQGYQDVRRGTSDSQLVLAKHPNRPNLSVKVHPELGLISIKHYWHLKKAKFGGHKDLMEKVNEANSESWRDTFYIDRDGDLAVSSYITLADQVSADDIASFLDRESGGFALVVAQSGLAEHME